MEHEGAVSKQGSRANKAAKVFAILQLLVCLSVTCEICQDSEAWMRFSRNWVVIAGAFVTFDVETLAIVGAGLVGYNLISLGALGLSLLALLRYKVQGATSTVAFAVGVLVLGSLLGLGAVDLFAWPV